MHSNKRAIAQKKLALLPFGAVIIICVLIITTGCQHIAVDNRLIGTWRHDTQRTLNELPQENTIALTKITKVIQWISKEKCGSFKVIYENDVYRTIIEGVSDRTVSYKIVERGTDYIVIDQFENGGITKINFVKDGFYVTQETDGVVFKDYFTNAQCPDN